jgi:hypothetical protein
MRKSEDLLQEGREPKALSVLSWEYSAMAVRFGVAAMVFYIERKNKESLI